MSFLMDIFYFFFVLLMSARIPGFFFVVLKLITTQNNSNTFSKTRFLFLLLIIVQLAQEMYLAGNWARITWSNNLLTSNKNVSKNHVRFQSNAELTKAINCGALWGVPYLVLYHIVNSACYLNVGQNDPCWIRKRSVCFWKIIF